MKLKIEQIGNETGVFLPAALVSRLNLDQGATRLDAALVNGGVHLLPCGPASDRATHSSDAGKRE